MTDRQKFWLKVVLAVTFPLWVFPLIACSIVFVIGLMIWEMASGIVEPGRSHGLGGGR